MKSGIEVTRCGVDHGPCFLSRVMIYVFSCSNSSRRIRGTRNISHRRFHLHSFSHQGRVGPMGPIAPGVSARLFHHAHLSSLAFVRARRRILKVFLDNNDKRSSSRQELFVSRSSRRGPPRKCGR